MKKTKEQKAITLVALIITIIVLLILAVVAIRAVTGDGIIAHAKNARTEYQESQKEEQSILDSYLGKINIEELPEKQITELKSGEVFNKTTKVKDSSGNIVIVPKGFKITDDANHITEGIVIEDATEAETKGSQFVWIPVGDIKKKDGTIQKIELKRYVFNTTTGEILLSESSPTTELLVRERYRITEGLKNQETSNAHAKDIEEFISKVNLYGGYYIGRYEARTNSTTTRNNGDNLTSVTCKKENSIYNNIKQLDASNLCLNMYKNTDIISDLLNGYAWDTAIVFIQTFSGDADYSIQTSLNTEFAEYGTVDDVRCNIYDMASNCREWTTETNSTDYIYTGTGGRYSKINLYTSHRFGAGQNFTDIALTFRTILYINI